MKSEWKAYSNPTGGKAVYGVYRLRDTAKVQHSGNMETRDHYGSRADAEAEAERLNREENGR